mmetsp:Transcript_30959/g.73833  ORF Transcript_30959/g.73833 Transcript_30959/m.73833 type:complete len:212 (+) Transcript_30959:3324-3959(+)
MHSYRLGLPIQLLTQYAQQSEPTGLLTQVLPMPVPKDGVGHVAVTMLGADWLKEPSGWQSMLLDAPGSNAYPNSGTTLQVSSVTLPAQSLVAPRRFGMPAVQGRGSQVGPADCTAGDEMAVLGTTSVYPAEVLGASSHKSTVALPTMSQPSEQKAVQSSPNCRVSQESSTPTGEKGATVSRRPQIVGLHTELGREKLPSARQVAVPSPASS